MSAGRSFGFDVKTSRRIDLDRTETGLADELAAAAGAWLSCINCGSCSATCPSGQNTGLNFRKIHYVIRHFGEQAQQPDDQRLASLEACLLCGKCQLVCPRGIPTRYLALLIMQKKRHAEGIPSV